MTKTLYFRTAITFIAAVVFSTIVATLVSRQLFRNQALEDMHRRLVYVGEEAIHAFQQDPRHFGLWLDGFSAGKQYRLSMYAEPVHGGKPFEIALSPWPSEHERASAPWDPFMRPGELIDDSIVKQVLAGRVYDESRHGFQPFGGSPMVLGLPFHFGSDSYALFIRPILFDRVHSINTVSLWILMLTLFVGILLNLIFSRFLVKPLELMTAATRELARGNFAVRLKIRRQDELGQLANGFNQMAEELEQMEEMRQEFVANVSHEIQSPLTSIRGFARALKEGIVEEGERDEYLDIIVKESSRLSKLGENLLRLASLDSDHHPFHPSTFLLDEQLRRTVVALQPMMEEKRHTVNLRLAKASIVADADLLSQVWVNLITNAVKFTPEEGVICISLTSRHEEAAVEISNTGAGIPSEALERIFDRFYTVDTSRNRAMGGSGLGLSIAKRIVQMHKGSIAASSEGGNTTFRVILPLME